MSGQQKGKNSMGKKITAALSLALAHVYLAFYRRIARVKPLSLDHVDQASRLLTEQFCLREPLCRSLKLDVERLLPFFRDQVTRAARNQLGLVAVGPSGDVLGAVILEDHAEPYVPGEEFLTPEFVAIGSLLDEVSLPPDLKGMHGGEMVYCALAAVKPGRHKAPILGLMTVAVTTLMVPRGYTKGYAKVTNPRIIDNFRKLEHLLGQKIFTVTLEKSDKDFSPGRFAPLMNFYVAVVHWNLAFLDG
jgi:hypothetical protein